MLLPSVRIGVLFAEGGSWCTARVRALGGTASGEFVGLLEVRVIGRSAVGVLSATPADGGVRILEPRAHLDVAPGSVRCFTVVTARGSATQRHALVEWMVSAGVHETMTVPVR